MIYSMRPLMNYGPMALRVSQFLHWKSDIKLQGLTLQKI